MLPMKDLFYGRAEPVWILNHKKDDDTSDEGENESGNKNEPENEGYSPPTSSHYYPYHRQFFSVPTYDSDHTEKKETKVVMKVPICCSECEESVKVGLYRLNGVESVICNIHREKVTVVGTALVAPADILMECKKIFKKSRMWNDDD